MIEDLSEKEYPILPHIFANNESSKTHPEEANKHPLLPLMLTSYDKLYPELFKDPSLFFKIYNPIIKEKFTEFLKKELKITKTSPYSLYFGESELENKNINKCVVIQKNGNIYEGEINEGKRHGEGTYVEYGVGWYNGAFNRDIKEGEGVEVHFQQDIYKGSFMNSMRHGMGTYVSSTITYEGSWKLGIIHGEGTMCSKFSTYKGSFMNALKHGIGEEIFVNGDKYKGNYVNNRFDGEGIYIWKDGAKYEGVFQNGLRHGKGVWTKEETKYSGTYGQGLKEGYGELYFKSGNFYKGNFLEDKKDGYGEMFWADGSFYKGNWNKEIQNGKGQVCIKENEILNGVFENGILVQVTPTIYEKQMEIAAMGIEDVFGHKKDNEEFLQTTNDMPKILFSKRSRFDLSPMRIASLPRTQKINKIETKSHLKNNLHYRSPEDHGDECKCVRRLEHFRMRQKSKAPN